MKAVGGAGGAANAALKQLTGIRDVLQLLPRINRRLTVLLVVGVTVGALLPVAVAIVTGRLIGEIPATVHSGFDSPSGRTTLALLAGIACGVVVQRAIGPLCAALGSSLGRWMERDLQERVMTSVARPAGISHLEDPDVLALLRMLRGLGMDTNKPADAVQAMVRVLPSWIQAIGSAAVMLAFHWWLGLIWLAVWPVFLYVLQREYLKVGEVNYGQSAALRRAEYLRDLAMTPAAAKELRTWGMLDWLVARFLAAWRTAIQPVWEARRFSPAVLWGTGAALLAINLASYGLLAAAAAHGAISLAALAVFTQAMSGVNSFRAFDDDNASMAFGLVAVPRVLELDQTLADREPASDRPRAELPAGAPADAIAFDDVTFRYPKGDRDAVAGLDLTIQAGRSLAIVGVNGAGKSSLVKLFCGLYVPDSGRITVDGTDLADIEPAAWQRRIAVLFQDFARYHLSARDNIALGLPEGTADDAAILAAAQQAGAVDLIDRLPAGLDTVLSRQYGNGVDLSGGEWQRVALARAMLAVSAGAKVLVLDEPTAALDVRAEAELYDRFLEITAGLTTVLISHRFSTVRRAERIVVLDGGRIREDGSHDELISLDGAYARMFELQAARFRDGDRDPTDPGDSGAAGDRQSDELAKEMATDA